MAKHLKTWSYRFALVIAALAASYSPAAWCEEAQPEQEVLLDEWQALYLQGQRMGYNHMQILKMSSPEATLYETMTQFQFDLLRMGVPLSMKQRSKVVEDEQGRLVSFRREMRQGPLRQIWRGHSEGDNLVIEMGTGEAMTTKTVPAPQGLCPWAVERLTRSKGYEPGTSYTVKVFAPELADAPAEPEMTVTVGEKEPKQVFEVTKWLHRLEITINLLPGITTNQWVDDSGQTWLLEMPLAPGMVFEMRKVAKAVALQPTDAPEFLFTASVFIDSAIEHPRTRPELTLLVTMKEEGAALPDIPQDPLQSVKRTERGLEVTIRRAAPSAEKSYALPYSGQEHAELLAATPWLEVEDPAIVELSRAAVGEERDALSAARKIERYVGEYITEKDLSLGFATAAETAKQKTGDCSEHAVLVAAVARAAGIPSRVVVGLLYAGPEDGLPRGGFFYHVWTEAFVGEWLPLDATTGGHDATHLAIGRSALNLSADLFAMAEPIIQVLGAIDIQVVAESQREPAH